MKYSDRVRGSVPPGEQTYVERKADRALYEKLKLGEFCFVSGPGSGSGQRGVPEQEKVVYSSSCISR